MRKANILYKILLVLTVVFINNSCKQSEFDENYYDPEKSVNATLEGLFTGFLYNHSFENRNTILPRYWNLRTFQTPMPGKYSQTVGYLNSNGRYELGLSYAEQRWDYFYNTHISGYRNMEKKFKELTPQEQAAFLPFMEVAKVLLYDQAAQMIDLWGDIPFTEAGKVITESGTLSKGKFDSGQDLYSFFLSDLKRIADYLNSTQIDAITLKIFGVNDIFFKGDLNKWKLYTNSLRLRLAMRISNVEENKAKVIVQEILGNQTAYPVINKVADNLAIKADGEILRSIVGKHEGGIRGGLIGELAPGKMINQIMAPSEDPRLKVLFSKNKYGKYVGVYEDWTEKRQEDSVSANYFSRVDSATFSKNDQFPGIIITASEISLFKAEALERWGIGSGTAQEAYENGIKQSIEYYYNINASNLNSDGTSYTPKVKPTEEEIETFLNSTIVNYSGTQLQKLEKIGNQQWINFGIIQSYHAWTEYRRSGYPLLNFTEDSSSPGTKKPPLRILYPNNEKNLNSVNYGSVADKDKITVKIFWQK